MSGGEADGGDRRDVVVAGAVGWVVRLAIVQLWPDGGKIAAAAVVVAVTAAGAAVYLLLARLVRLREVTEIISLVTGRFRR